MPDPITKGQIPARPDLSQIQDPAAKVAIENLYTGWEFRNGLTGKGDQRFITKQEAAKNLADALANLPNSQPSTVNVSQGDTTTPASDFTTYLQLTDPPQSSISGEQNGWAADITLTTGNLFAVGSHSHLVSMGGHSGVLFGVTSEVYNSTTKTPGSPTQLFGAVHTVLNLVYHGNAPFHAGVWAIFRNRLVGQTTPVNGAPPPSQAYNKNTAAFRVDSAGRGSNGAITCGWEKGIYFAPGSIDRSGPSANAIVIDMTDLASIYPGNIQSMIALPDDTYMSFSSDKTSSRLGFQGATGKLLLQNSNTGETVSLHSKWGFTVNAGLGGPGGYWFDQTYDVGLLYTPSLNGSGPALYAQAPGSGLGWILGFNGVFYGNDPSLSHYLDLNAGHDSVLAFTSGSKTAPPQNLTSIANWMGVTIDGIRFCAALYR